MLIERFITRNISIIRISEGSSGSSGSSGSFAAALAEEDVKRASKEDSEGSLVLGSAGAWLNGNIPDGADEGWGL